jgi:signal transduction histidine kinase
MGGVGALAVGVAVALVILTSSLYQAGIRLADATERMRLLMELESYALQRVRDGASSSQQRVSEISERLRRQTPVPDGEIDRLDDMMRSLGEASTAEERDATLDALIPALRSVVAGEDERARRAMAEAAWWNTVGNVTGIAATLVLLGGVTTVLAWVWRSALQPLLTMIETIGRVGRGDVGARVAEEGPGEIREIAAAFNEMTSTLGQRREQQLAFIGGVAHDLRTPLNALQVAMTLLDQPGADPVRVRERMRRQIGRMQHMVGDLLDRTRIETGRFELDWQSCDIRDPLSRVVELQRDSSPRVIRLQMPPEPMVARCDPLRIEQVVTNLLSNALKYSPESTDVEIFLQRDGPDAVLAVADHGIGMTAVDRTKVFEPFRRGQNVGHIGGTGLGLSVARRIVEAHGGDIHVRSELGLGSTFVVRLPLAGDADTNRHFSATDQSPAPLMAQTR